MASRFHLYPTHVAIRGSTSSSSSVTEEADSIANKAAVVAWVSRGRGNAGGWRSHQVPPRPKASPKRIDDGSFPSFAISPPPPPMPPLAPRKSHRQDDGSFPSIHDSDEESKSVSSSSCISSLPYKPAQKLSSSTRSERIETDQVEVDEQLEKEHAEIESKTTLKKTKEVPPEEQEQREAPPAGEDHPVTQPEPIELDQEQRQLSNTKSKTSDTSKTYSSYDGGVSLIMDCHTGKLIPNVVMVHAQEERGCSEFVQFSLFASSSRQSRKKLPKPPTAPTTRMASTE